MDSFLSLAWDKVACWGRGGGEWMAPRKHPTRLKLPQSALMDPGRYRGGWLENLWALWDKGDRDWRSDLRFRICYFSLYSIPPSKQIALPRSTGKVQIKKVFEMYGYQRGRGD